MLVQASVLTTTTALSGAMLRWCCCLVIVGAPLTAAARPPITLMVTNGPRLMRQSSNSEEVEPVHRRPSPTKLMDGSSPGFSYSGGSLHWEDPIIYTWDEYLSEAECSAIIALATPGLHRANVSDDFGGSTSDGRTNDVSWLTHNQDPLVWDIVQRISSLVGLPSTHAENLQVIQYEAGEEYTRHWDAYDHGTVDGDTTMKDGGNRVITALLYLNDVAKGGETQLVNLGFKVNPERGRLLVFHDCYNGSATKHPDSYHAGLPPTSGTKWAANLWFHEKPTQAGTMAKLSREGTPTPRDLLTHIAESDTAADETLKPKHKPSEEELDALMEKLGSLFSESLPEEFVPLEPPSAILPPTPPPPPPPSPPQPTARHHARKRAVKHRTEKASPESGVGELYNILGQLSEKEKQDLLQSMVGQ